MKRNAALLRRAFERRGFVMTEDENDGDPLLAGSLGAPDPAKKTVLYYLHYDGSAIISKADWSQKDPFEPALKEKGEDGVWREIPLERMKSPDFNPEWRLFARSAADDKGPIGMFLASLDLIKGEGLTHAANVKVLLDPREEVNSPGLSEFIAARRQELRADAVVVLDTPAHASGRPTIVFGNRGLVRARLTVYGPKTPMHSGHYGNFIPNPARLLARLLTSFTDEDGRALIPGFYDGVKLNQEDMTALKAAGDDDAGLLKRAGVARPDKVAPTCGEALQYPGINIRGLSSGGSGLKAPNVIPATATAELDLRTVRERNGPEAIKLLRAHIRTQGYTLLDHAPTDEERAAHPRLAVLEVLERPVEAVRQPFSSPAGLWAKKALTDAFAGPEAGGLAPVLIRSMGGTIPTFNLITPLGQPPFVVIPCVNQDNNQHAADENLRLGHYLFGMRNLVGLMTEPLP